MAREWLKVSKSGTRQIKLQLKGSAVLKAPAASLELECKGGISEGETIEGNGGSQGQAKGRLSFSSCKVLKPTGCVVVEPVVTNPNKAYLAAAGTQTGIVEVFEPGQGTVLASIRFSKCIFFKEVGLVGSIAAEPLPARMEEQESLLVFPTEAITTIKHEGVEKTLKLEVIGSAATFSGAYGMRLATFPEKFGVFGN